MVMWGHPISTPDICRWCNPGRTGCPLLALSGHLNSGAWCLLLGVGRTQPLSDYEAKPLIGFKIEYLNLRYPQTYPRSVSKLID